MTKHLAPPKPQTILYAQYSLWAWTAWKSVYGVYESWASFPEMERLTQTQMQGLVTIDLTTVMALAVGFYAALVLSMAWFIKKIADGKNWTRACLAINLLVTFAAAAFTTNENLLEYWPFLFDLGLQAYALYLLYTWPGRTWFNREEWAVVEE